MWFGKLWSSFCWVKDRGENGRFYNHHLQSVTEGVTLRFVIKKFKHKGLKKFFSTGSKVGIPATHATRIRLILGRLHASIEPADMNLPGLRLHELTLNRKGTWSVEVSGNWRITFKFDGPNVTDVNYEDYH